MKRKIQPFLSLLFTIFLLQAGYSQDPVSFIASEHTSESGDAVQVTVTVKDFTDIISAQFTMAYDPTVLNYVSVDDFGLDYMSESSFGKPPQIEEGTITFAWYDETLSGISIDDNTIIYSLTFQVVGTMGDSTGIDFTNSPTMIEVSNSGGVVNPIFESGYVKIPGVNSAKEIVTGAFVFYPVYPNPVKEMAHLKFELLQREEVSLSVFDANGRYVYQMTKVLAAGEHVIEIPGTQFKAAGTYFCRLEAGNHKGTQQLLLVR